MPIKSPPLGWLAVPLLMKMATKSPISEPISEADGSAEIWGAVRFAVGASAAPINELVCTLPGSTTKLLRAGSAVPTLMSSSWLCVAGWPNSRRTKARAAHMNGSCTGVPGSVPLACGPKPSEDNSPAMSVVTMLGGVAAAGAALDGGARVVAADEIRWEPDEFVTESVAGISTDTTAVVFGASCVAGADADDVEAADDMALNVVTLVGLLVESLASS